jgi:hypothetical protein
MAVVPGLDQTRILHVSKVTMLFEFCDARDPPKTGMAGFLVAETKVGISTRKTAPLAEIKKNLSERIAKEPRA